MHVCVQYQDGFFTPTYPNQIDSALCLKFTLAPSTYATMLLRELLKRSMTADEMKKMNPSPPTQSKAVEEEGVGGVKEGGDGCGEVI